MNDTSSREDSSLLDPSNESTIHKLLRITPGHAPSWLYSPLRCGPKDIFVPLVSAGIVVTVYVNHFLGMMPAIILSIVLCVIVYQASVFKKCERAARKIRDLNR